MRRDSILSRVLMALSPHREHDLDAEVERTREQVERREAQRNAATQKHQEYIDLQMQIMRRQ